MRKKKEVAIQSSSIESSFIQEISFLTYQEEISRFNNQCRQMRESRQKKEEENIIEENQEFTQEEREHLKNAFRYICRLAFKESEKYMNKIQEMIRKMATSKLQQTTIHEKMDNLLKDAEMISGQRYFKEYLQNLSIDNQKIIVEYMIWFLEKKYVRYLKKTESEKGKRKNMKKDLYLRFKNEIMLPYLASHSEILERS